LATVHKSILVRGNREKFHSNVSFLFSSEKYNILIYKILQIGEKIDISINFEEIIVSILVQISKIITKQIALNIVETNTKEAL